MTSPNSTGESQQCDLKKPRCRRALTINTLHKNQHIFNLVENNQLFLKKFFAEQLLNLEVCKLY